MINSHLLYRLSYRGTTTRMLLIKKEKSTFWVSVVLLVFPWYGFTNFG